MKGTLASAIVTAAVASGPASLEPTRWYDPPQRIALIPVLVGVELERAWFERLVANIGRHVGLAPLGFEPLFLDGSPPPGVRALACASDLDCTGDALGTTAPWALIVTANASFEPPLLTVELLDTREDSVRGRRVGEGSIESELSNLIEDVLVEAGFPVGGTLRLTVLPPEARMTPGPLGLEGQERSLLLPLGTHRFVFDAQGYRPLTQTVRVGPEETSLRVELEPRSAESSVWSSPWLWTAIGVAVAGTAAVVIWQATDGADPSAPCWCLAPAGGGACRPCGP